MYILDDHFRPPGPQSMPNHSQQQRINYGDNSWPLYGIYSNIVQEEDNKEAESIQQYINGILILVSLSVTSPLLHISI